MKAFVIGHHLKSGKPKLLVKSGDVRSVFYGNQVIEEHLVVPCGKCVECRLDYSRDWANRCYLESKSYKDNYFLTLTYDDVSLPMVSSIDNETGELVRRSTLRPKDMTDFIKRLRRYYDFHFNHQGIRFYYCGEYGDHTFRAHYHMLVFNLPIADLKFYKNNFDKGTYFNSDVISKL